MAIRLRSLIQPYTISEAAKMLYVGRPALSRLLNGKADLSVEMACAFEDVFRYSGLALLEMQTQEEYNNYRKIIGSKILPVFRNGIIG